MKSEDINSDVLTACKDPRTSQSSGVTVAKLRGSRGATRSGFRQRTDSQPALVGEEQFEVGE